MNKTFLIYTNAPIYMDYPTTTLLDHLPLRVSEWGRLVGECFRAVECDPTYEIRQVIHYGAAGFIATTANGLAELYEAGMVDLG